MAFTLNINVELVKYNEVLQMRITDKTGTGVNGYTGTKSVATINLLTIKFVKPDGATLGTYDIFNDGVSDGNITSVSNFAQGLESIYLTHDEIFGSSGTLIDGNYDITYEVDWSGDTKEELTKTLLAYKTVNDCIQKNISNLSIPKCECKWDTLELWMIAAFYLDTLKAQACLGEESKFLSTLLVLEKICTIGNSNCKPCKC